MTEAMQRMRELSITALNGTYTNEDREMIQSEYENLKEYINNVSLSTEFNTINVYEEHSPTYEKFKGNKVLEDEVTVIKGVTDYLGIKVDGELKEVYLDPGIYSREAFLDMLDDKLWDIDKNLIPSLDKNNVLSLSAENYKKIDGLVGGALSFFYEYHISMGAGTVFGSSDLSGKLDVISGSNDKLTFTIDDKKYNINFPSTPYPPYMGNGYTSDKIVEIIQNQLDAQGADVKVYMNGNQIALDAGYRIIDGFAGNMIKIDGITSILYDNSKHGEIIKSQGYVHGRVPIDTPIEIKEGVNDTISFYLNGEELKNEIVLTAKKYEDLNQVIDEINTQLKAKDIEACAKSIYSFQLDNYNTVAIYSNKKGPESKVKLDNTSNAYEYIFKYKTTNRPIVSVGKTTTAQVIGGKLDDNIEIKKGINDTLKLKVNGEDKILTIPSGIHTISDLEKELNIQINLSKADIRAVILGTTLTLTHNKSGEGNSIIVDTSSNAYFTLFSNKTLPNYIEGQTKVTPPKEGSTEPIYEYTSGKVESYNNISKMF